VTKSGIPRPIEGAIALAGLVAVSPLLLLTAASVILGSGRPALFRQTRVGRFGRPFIMYKFRTMRNDPSGPAVTAGDDPRITRIGALLRRTKLDELPELWNVVRGEMSLVGPRPEAPRYVDAAEQRWERVLSVRPGITDPTTLTLIDEESLLASVEGDREQYYREHLVPKKLDGYIAYLERRSWRSDLGILLRTVGSLVLRKP
jgi:lipopolysaccharide/colanic/teichoic acid biosynthesis glycosyltransferase